MKKNLIFGAIYGTGLLVLAFGAAGFGEGTPSIFLLVSAPLILPLLAPFLWMGIFVLLSRNRRLFVLAMLLHYLGAVVILALLWAGKDWGEDPDHFVFVAEGHPWFIALPLVVYFAGQLGLWMAFVLANADTSARRRRKVAAVLVAFTAAMLGTAILWSQMKGHYVIHSEADSHIRLGFDLAHPAPSRSTAADYDGAIAEYRKAITLDPENSTAHFWLGYVLAQKRDYGGAVVEYRKALALKPRDPSSHMRLGNALAAKGDYDGAVAEYQDAIALEPHQTGAHNDLGSALMQKGDYDAAIAEYRKAIALEPDNADAHYNLGSALAQRKNYAGAITEYRKAIALNPDHAGARADLDRLLRIAGRQDEVVNETRQTGQGRDWD